MVQKDDLPWEEVEINGYDGKSKKVKFLTNTSLWGVDSFGPIAIKWLVVVDPQGDMDPLPLMSTDVTLKADKIIQMYVDRWGLEVTFQEVREHLGVETQRRWSDKVIARKTPILMGLYSVVCLIGNRMNNESELIPEKTVWYNKESISFSDLIKCVRTHIWRDSLFFREECLDASEEIQLNDDGDWRDWVIGSLARAA